MNKKDLIRHIKQKASEIEVKDFSSEIIAKAKAFPREEIKVKEPKRSIFAKPLLQMSFVTIVGIFIMMFILQPNNQIYAFEEQDQVFVSSALTSLSYLDSSDSELSQSTSFMLSSSVSDEIDDVVLFAELSERLLETKQIQKNKDIIGYDVELSFDSTNFLGNTESYFIRYHETKESKNTYRYEGVIVVGNESYPFQAEIIRGKQNSFQFEIIQESQMIELNYLHKQDGYLYQFKYYKDQILNQSFDMKELTLNNKQHIMVNFRENVSQGVYTFHMEEQNSQKYLRASYLIQKDESEDGEIIITPQNGNYEIEIRPNGQPPIIIEKGRRPDRHHDDHPGNNGRM